MACVSAIATVVCHWKVCVVVVIIVIVACTRICAHTKKIMKKKNIKIRYRIQQQQIPLHLRFATSKYVSHVKSQRKYKKKPNKKRKKKESVCWARARSRMLADIYSLQNVSDHSPGIRYIHNTYAHFSITIWVLLAHFDLYWIHTPKVNVLLFSVCQSILS